MQPLLLLSEFDTLSTTRGVARREREREIRELDESLHKIKKIQREVQKKKKKLRFSFFFSLSLYVSLSPEPPGISIPDQMAALIVARRGAALQCAAPGLRQQSRRQSASMSFAAKPPPPADSTSTSTSTTLTRGPHSHVHEVNRSKFLATAFGSVRSSAEALSLIKASSARDASHNCFAFVIRRGLSERCSDDGEPAGTAGRPILAAISSSQERLESVAVLVSRWRAGPKLGPGGLSRAYGAAARGCLRLAAEVPGNLVTLEESCVVEVVVAVDAVGGAYAALSSSSGSAASIREEYGTGNDDGNCSSSASSSTSTPPLAPGLVRLRATVPLSAVAAVSAAVAGASGGKGVVSVVVEEGGGGRARM